MSTTTETSGKARVTPNSGIALMWIQHIREDAARAGDELTEQAAYSVLWFLGTGRSFTGLERALAHMTKGTVQAFVRRVAKGMLVSGRERRGASTQHIVTGDLSNDVLARALGCAGWHEAEQMCCAHPYGQRLTLG